MPKIEITSTIGGNTITVVVEDVISTEHPAVRELREAGYTS